MRAGGRSERKGCITTLKISAMTGKRKGAGFSMQRGGHRIVLRLRSEQELQGVLRGPAYYNWPYILEMNFAQDFGAGNQCVMYADISQVSLLAGGDDNWYIARIKTAVKVGTGPYKVLTNDLDFNKWLDRSYTNTAKLVLTLSKVSIGVEDAPPCSHGTPVCECKPEAETCVFNLEIDEIRTFTSYRKIPSGSEYDVQDTHGVVYSIGADGEIRPLKQHKDRYCAKHLNFVNCSEPQFVDGKTYRMAIGVNGQIPGPTIIVHEGQRVIIDVHNNLTTDGISVHWHGLHQVGTPWMDGVGQLTQCQIDASSSFSYVYRASSSGTFWYHSHSGTQRTDGLFGALIVKERPQRLKVIKSKLFLNYGVSDFQDIPGKHTITLLDWQQEASLDMLTQLTSSLGFYPDVPIGEVPPSDTNSVYKSTLTYDHSAVGAVPYFSGLISGKGRHKDVPYAKTRLSVFTVERGNSYRFHLIGAQNHYAYKFSIDGHRLTVVGTDGYWIEPQKRVDYIIIHSGERYDFILDTDATSGDYFWIRAETLEIDTQSNRGKPPYKALDHTAEAILQYIEKDVAAPGIHSTDYESIKLNSKPRNCHVQGCKAVNCPFEAFHPSYNIECVNIHKLRLLEETSKDHLPQALPPSDCHDCLHFINFGFEGESGSSSANGRNLILPPVPPLTQNDDFQKQAVQCSHATNCNPFIPDCKCTHVINIPFKKTVQFVFSSMGGELQSHPIHLHGHSFHVVHIGYPEYNGSTGFLIPNRQSPDIQCLDTCTYRSRGCNPRLCTKPSWKNSMPPRSLSIDPYTVRKDTVIVPAGGYAVVNFISDNPGFWFLHCHVEAHQFQGMGLFVNEAFSEQQKLNTPKSANRCGDVD